MRRRRLGVPVSGPYYQPPRLPVDRWFSSERGIGLVASVLIGLVASLSVLYAAAEWQHYRVVKAYVDGPIRDPDSIDNAELVVVALAVCNLLALVAAAIVFIVWLWRVRWNAELFCRARHRHGRGWVIGSWFCPIVNLWFPKQIVDDVIAASDRRTPAQTEHLRGIPGTGLVWAWWLTWVGSLLLDGLVTSGVGRLDVDGWLLVAGLSTASAVAYCVAAVLAIQVIGRVNESQTTRPWTPWWAATTAPPVHARASGMPQYGPPGYRGRLGHSSSPDRHVL
jgi:Domain of unknown function (DUF4328)